MVRTLRNAVEQDKVHHAYLFVGSRGTGKTSMAKILAACLNCVSGPTIEPCGKCDSCVSIASATSLDVIEMDAASNNSVDDIRDLREKVAYAPVSGRHKVYILDEAHMLSPQAWNAFLKTLEEPPPRTIFVLATTEAQKVLPTVVDRCHRFDFGRPSVEQVATVLGASPGRRRSSRRRRPGARRPPRHRQLPRRARDARAARHLRRRAARSSPAMCWPCSASPTPSSCSKPSTRWSRVTPPRALRAATKLAESGRDPGQVLRDLEVHGRELLDGAGPRARCPPSCASPPSATSGSSSRPQALAGTDAVRLLDLVSGALDATTNGAQARIQLELLLIKAAAPEVDPSTAALLSRIERLESGARSRPATPARRAGPARRRAGAAPR